VITAISSKILEKNASEQNKAGDHATQDSAGGSDD